MRRLLLHTLPFFLALLPLSGFGQTSTALSTWVSEHEGVWMTENQLPGIDEDARMVWVLQLDRKHIEGERVAIMVSEYCRPGIAEALWFRLEENQLVFDGAVRTGINSDLHQIESARLWSLDRAGETRLSLAITEVDKQWSLQETFRALPVATHAGWAWGWQHDLVGFLSEGAYEVWDAKGNPNTLGNIFQHPSLIADMAFVESNPGLFPMFEEICLRTESPLILLGGANPTGDLQAYMVDWQENGIYLFDTYVDPASEDGALPLLKGKHLATIVPSYAPFLHLIPNTQ